MILVTGGAGYTGSVLVKELLHKGHEVRVIDAMWFGNHLKESKNLEIVEKSCSLLEAKDFEGIDTVVHLANVANDPSVDLAPVMSWEINVLELKMILDLSKKSGVEKFIFASSGSVYGLKSEDRVTEDLDLVPISVYNKTKMIAERVVSSYSAEFLTYNLRPATVCGISPRMRFDVVLNMFVKQAFVDGAINILGGDQIRPNIHINDLASAYLHLIDGNHPAGSYNAGFENVSIKTIAEKIRAKLDCEIRVHDSNDPRSYRQDSSKLLSTGFNPKYGIDSAIEELISAFSSGTIKDDPRWYNVSWMKKNGIGIQWASK
jgi:nucleoside-diphosphate-sugar epimerase